MKTSSIPIFGTNYERAAAAVNLDPRYAHQPVPEIKDPSALVIYPTGEDAGLRLTVSGLIENLAKKLV